MTHDVVMPQLGMTQTHGKIVKWCKKPGDQVKPGDVLMEVESDKAIVEVESSHNGVFLETRYGEDVEVEVGSVVAVIADKGESAAPKAVPAKAKEEPVSHQAKDDQSTEKEQIPPREPTPTSAKVNPVANSSGSGEKILASPKAKKAASQMGIDLRELRSTGFKEPFHSADLGKFQSMRSRSGASVLVIETPVNAFMDFVQWAKDRTSGAASNGSVLRAFASGAWYKSMGVDVVIEYSRLDGSEPSHLQGRGRTGLGEDEVVVDSLPDLVLFDLTDSELVGYQPGHTLKAPTLTVAVDAKNVLIACLYFDERNLSMDLAKAFLLSFKKRLDEPLHHLL